MHTGYDLFHIVHPDMALSNRPQSYYCMRQLAGCVIHDDCQ
jgi:hypothetical protein